MINQEKVMLLSEAQAAFLTCPKPFAAFVGGIGSGKSFVLCYDLLKRVRHQGLYMVIAPTFRMLADATLRSFMDVARRMSVLFSFHKSDYRIHLQKTDADVLFRSADEPERLRGPNLHGVVLDEASLMVREVFEISIGRLRADKEMGFLRAALTPKGKLHWTYEIFTRDSGDVALIRTRTSDNPFLPETFERAVRAQYTSRLAAQELEGEFLEGEGYLFRREWFAIVEAAPTGLACVRFWDLAATEKKQGQDPDWTAGVLLGKAKDGVYYVLDVRHVRATPRAVQELVVGTAQADGQTVPIWMEEEGGSAGKIVTDIYTRLLAGYSFHGERPTGDKTVRAQGLAAQAEAGNVKLVKGDWCKDFLDEIESFPFGAHDDQIDATAGAFNKLTLGPYRRVSIYV